MKLWTFLDAVNKNAGQKMPYFKDTKIATIYLASDESGLGIFYLVNKIVNKFVQMLTKMLIILSR
jgi:hypothetical protein